MSDDKSKTGGQDRTRISTSEDYEVRDWAAKLGVRKVRLLEAVARVGNQASAVEAHLKAVKGDADKNLDWLCGDAQALTMLGGAAKAQ